MPEPTARTRCKAKDLIDFASALLVKAGMESDRAGVVAALLVEGDLLGHTTHGLALLPLYLGQIESGAMAKSGDPDVVVDRAAISVWDGRRLPGLWLTARAVETACARARDYGIAAVSIRNSGHIGCLAAFLERPAREGMMVMVSSSDPAAKAVVPFGGTKPLMSPNPIAIGIPTDADPIMIDISASITTMGMARRLRQSGGKFPGNWAIDAAGNPTDDPSILLADPPGALLPVGGLDHGHKGFALSLFVEALTQGTSGFGRADPPIGGGASVWVQAIDPALFAGSEAFTRQTSWLTEACRANSPMPDAAAVRLPGEHGLVRKREALTNGVPLYGGVLEALTPWAQRWGIGVPQAILN